MRLIRGTHSEEQEAINMVQGEKEDMGLFSTGSEGKKYEDAPKKTENRVESGAPGSTCATDINAHTHPLTHTSVSHDHDRHLSAPSHLSLSLSQVIAAQS